MKHSKGVAIALLLPLVRWVGTGTTNLNVISLPVGATEISAWIRPFAFTPAMVSVGTLMPLTRTV